MTGQSLVTVGLMAESTKNIVDERNVLIRSKYHVLEMVAHALVLNLIIFLN